MSGCIKLSFLLALCQARLMKPGIDLLSVNKKIRCLDKYVIASDLSLVSLVLRHV